MGRVYPTVSLYRCNSGRVCRCVAFPHITCELTNSARRRGRHVFCDAGGLGGGCGSSANGRDRAGGAHADDLTGSATSPLAARPASSHASPHRPVSAHPAPACLSGTWQYNSSLAESVVSLGLKLGFTHIDTANDYKNQDGVGRALASRRRRSGRSRSAAAAALLLALALALALSHFRTRTPTRP